MPFLQNLGVEATIITRAVPDVPLEDVIDGVTVLRFDIGEQHPTILHHKAVKYFKQTNTYPDVLQTLVYFNSRAIAPFWHLQRHNVPAIYTVTMAFNRVSLSRWQQVKLLLLNRVVNALFAAVVVSTQTVRVRLVKEGVMPERMHVIPNGVNVQRFHPPASVDEKRQIRRRLQIPEDALIVLYTGFIEQRKGIEELIPAWMQTYQHNPNLHLWLVGPRPRSNELHKLKPDLADFLATDAIQWNIHQTGFTENVELYLRAADLFVFPSHREGGMPNSLMEAFATGLPAIVTPYTGLSPETGQPGVHYRLVSHDPKDIAAAILTLAEDAAQRQQLGQAALELIQQSMTTEQVTQSLYNLYYQVQV